jgi:putative membrane protein
MSVLQDPRVLFAAERTLLAWNRTSLTLIAFGFLVERSGLLWGVVSPSRVNPGSEILTFWLGLAFIALGVFAAAYSSRQYIFVLKTLNPAEFPQGYAPKWGLFVNGAVALLGAALVIALYVGRT